MLANWISPSLGCRRKVGAIIVAATASMYSERVLIVTANRSSNQMPFPLGVLRPRRAVLSAHFSLGVVPSLPSLPSLHSRCSSASACCSLGALFSRRTFLSALFPLFPLFPLFTLGILRARRALLSVCVSLGVRVLGRVSVLLGVPCFGVARRSLLAIFRCIALILC
jgi:hypothetical protein